MLVFQQTGQAFRHLVADPSSQLDDSPQLSRRGEEAGGAGKSRIVRAYQGLVTIDSALGETNDGLVHHGEGLERPLKIALETGDVGGSAGRLSRVCRRAPLEGRQTVDPVSVFRDVDDVLWEHRLDEITHRS